ncbi:MAG: DNA recombination/repair protein RecA, partial [Firmicutes bacterium]|nr:DNA recombination/repair protein RecA [Bacillota bacterium]
VRLDVRRIEAIKVGDSVVGNRPRVKVVKNKVAPPFKMTEFDIMYGEGISRAGDVLDCAVDAGLIEKSGAWYSYNGDRIGQGRENVKQYLKDNPDLIEDLENRIREKYVAKKDESGISDDDVYEVDADGVILD